MDSPYENQVGGDHYKGVKVQPCWLAEELELKPCDFSILKYIMRDKDGKEGRIRDLKKILDYITKARFHGREACFWSVVNKDIELVRSYIGQFADVIKAFNSALFWGDYNELEAGVKLELERLQSE